MMVILKTKEELQLMRKAGAITAAALHAGGAAIKPGITTRQVDRVIHDYIVRCGAKPSFLGYGGFPASACISVNDEVIHGIPGGRVICEGDIVSIDVGAKIGGYHGDSAYTFACGKISPQAQALLDGTKKALEKTHEAQSRRAVALSYPYFSFLLFTYLPRLVISLICLSTRSAFLFSE